MWIAVSPATCRSKQAPTSISISYGWALIGRTIINQQKISKMSNPRFYSNANTFFEIFKIVTVVALFLLWLFLSWSSTRVSYSMQPTSWHRCKEYNEISLHPKWWVVFSKCSRLFVSCEGQFRQTPKKKWCQMGMLCAHHWLPRGCFQSTSSGRSLQSYSITSHAWTWKGDFVDSYSSLQRGRRG